VLQVIAIGLYLLPLTGPLATGRAWVMGAALIVTLVTGVDYVARAVRLRRTAAASS
jgi:CDP-diacylglycerol---glycerol-3-phosphate 3-phosphatidyltransferase